MRVFCDFDGTISIEDATDMVLSRFAGPEWEDIERLWKQGLIGSGECMRRQIALIQASRGELDRFLDTLAIDPGFEAFLSFCRRGDLPVTIVSDGVDYFIRRILARHGMDGLPIIANVLTCSVSQGRESYSLFPPFTAIGCVSGAGVCKCRVVDSHGLQVYIGDGRSDFCVSDKVDLVFAKAKLVDYCEENGIPYVGFNDFFDLLPKMEAVLPSVERRSRTLPQVKTA
ncbi:MULTISPECIES: MtnX-like HAD-IB family phosphatase [unclassified Rhizobium]|uniref:MtnX-like HAD-IB family phosphatase n=1 Tax=unclassified Rhizobium TaxID=2613769 RepID=UPI00161DC8C8|nr:MULTISPECIES: MtnX-like HAD-IB family phosphatase [unclassified Rhizobium]MBB3286521.1 2,3-diketo-5-methylthio-1-phosphopentane phosphatase [Rhizobium sp. BK252]MBB3401285.1 2,3-diketo-5-methylthio-1-phosphopentane phosphatase [Rhizobium sp. BK289]MBB3413863.1 2,3-diketo-5-methylthio-1-phosphopentane phosphatase [Rhizobium sp. BK284]MBB3481750.1 2,3-diketo-5-methylthio-1-phosphopentane phosphatase [Rhizobium sp. BK347]